MAKKNNFKKHLQAKNNKFDFLNSTWFYILVSIISLLVGIRFISLALKDTNKDKLIFLEKGGIKYSVCLKENDFFEDNCLSSNMSYVASLIKKISLDFNYQLNSNIDDLIDAVDYEITAKLIIKNGDTSTKYYEKDYNLVSKTTDVIDNNNTFYNLNKSVDINYDYYNEIANSFKAMYGINSQSYLEVYLNTSNKVNSKYDNIPTSSQLLVQIPLSQKAIEINLKTQEVNKSIEKNITNYSFDIGQWAKMAVGVFWTLLACFCLGVVLYRVIKNRKKLSKYDKYINKLLREYDRLIVDTSTKPNVNDYNVLNIKSFSELVDVRDNLRLPIMYYNDKKREKAKFYILQDNNLYLFEVNKKSLAKSIID